MSIYTDNSRDYPHDLLQGFLLFPIFEQKSENVKTCQKSDENIKDARQNSEQIRRIHTSWGPLVDHFPDSNIFPQIGQIGPIPQTVQIWPSGQASGLGSQTPGVLGSIPRVCSNLGVSGWTQNFFRRNINLSQN